MRERGARGVGWYGARPVQGVRRSRDAFLDDPDLAALDRVVPAFDPLEVLRWTHAERPHTRFLAWLLDPRPARPGGDHALGARALRALVQLGARAREALPGDDVTALPDDPGEVPASATVWCEQPLGDGVRETARAPDIRCEWTCETGSWLVLIENKIDAAEGDAQLAEYLDWARRHRPDAHRLTLYLTPDGRAPERSSLREPVACLAWSDVARALLDAVDNVDPERPSHRFVVMVLAALRARYGGDDTARALVAALHARHPRAAGRAASPAVDTSELAGFGARFPNALWHLRTLRPRAQSWTRAWAERVASSWAEAFPDAPRLTAHAPHAGCRDMASWTLASVTDTLSLHVLCGRDPSAPAARPRVWVGMYAPNLRADEVIVARELTERLEAMAPRSRDAIVRATPAQVHHGAWRWLAVGRSARWTRGFSPDDDARRVAEAIHGVLGEHLDAWRSEDSDARLYSGDLDPEHALPDESRDRETLRAQRRDDAWHVWIAAPRPTGHPYELRDPCALGRALSRAFGGTGALSYALGASELRAGCVVVGSWVLRAPHDAALGEGVVRALGDGASLVVWLDDGWDLARSPAWLAPYLGPLDAEGTAWRDDVLALTGVPSLEADARRVAGLWTLPEDPRVTVHLAAQVADRVVPVLSSWRHDGARVLCWNGGDHGARLRERPDRFARWWDAVRSCCDGAPS